VPIQTRISIAVALACVLAYRTALAVDPDSQPIGCDRADDRVRIEVSSHLDPSCTWTRGVEIVASGVVLDCQGARIAAPDRRFGIAILSPIDVALSNVTVRNCHVEGFLNNLHIEREGFMTLAEGVEYDHAWSNILIEDSTFLNSRGVGIFVDGYVTGVTLRNLHVEGSGSTGIYLEAGSKDNVVEGNTIVDNGYRENGPDGQLFDFAGVDFWFWGTGREGLAIDGSRNNRVVDNFFSGNSAGAIFLYKNCGEFVNVRPDDWWHRRYGADGNLIEGNTIVGERNGVWIGSRMSENVLPMDCSDPKYLPGISLDRADDNVVRANVFQNVGYGVRVEDDGAVVADNEFAGDDPAQQAVVVGTQYRTSALGQPVDRATVTGNDATIAGNGNPYRWIHGHTNTTFATNRSHGRIVGLCEGEQPWRGPFVMTVAFALADPENPPSGPPPTIPPAEPLPPCPLACTSGAAVARPSAAVRNVRTPPGDDVLVVAGEPTLSYPFDPPLDPVAIGIGLVVTDATGTRVVDLTVPPGAYDPATRRGWRTARGGNAWTWLDRSGTRFGGVTRVEVRHRARKQPGLVRVRLRAERGSWPIDPTELPLAVLLVLDPPTAETGQCGAASFAGPAPRCTTDGRTIRCR
jgi:parallel beta-helix repeat protein